MKNQVRMRKLTYARSPIVCLRYVGDYEVSLNDRGTTGSTFEVPSFELLLFLPPWYNEEIRQHKRKRRKAEKRWIESGHSIV